MKIILRGIKVEKKTKFSLTKNFTIRSLCLILCLSVIATALGFASAYNEHRNLTELWDKYDEAMVKIEDCENAIAELSQKIADNNIVVSEKEEYSQEDYSEDASGENITVTDKTDNPPATADKTESTTSTSSAVSSGKYYVTKSGSKYHVGTCSFLSKSKIAITMEQIKAEGYTPCSRCIK